MRYKKSGENNLSRLIVPTNGIDIATFVISIEIVGENNFAATLMQDSEKRENEQNPNAKNFSILRFFNILSFEFWCCFPDKYRGRI